MKKLLKYNLVLLLIVIASCKKKAIEVDEHLKGYWRGFDDIHTIAILEIKDDSYCKYDESPNWSEGGHGHVYGIARCEGNLLKVGPYTKFRILEFPTMIDTSLSQFTVLDKKANWRMKLELPKRFSSSGYFYMADY